MHFRGDTSLKIIVFRSWCVDTFVIPGKWRTVPTRKKGGKKKERRRSSTHPSLKHRASYYNYCSSRPVIMIRLIGSQIFTSTNIERSLRGYTLWIPFARLLRLMIRKRITRSVLPKIKFQRFGDTVEQHKYATNNNQHSAYNDYTLLLISFHAVSPSYLRESRETPT